MMLLPRSVAAAAALVRKQVGTLLPSTYCSPYCPGCRAEVAVFNASVSCVYNSNFITDCGACQQCIISTNIEEGNGLEGAATVIEILTNVLNLCSNSTQVQALESQASRLSQVGDYISVTSMSTATQTLPVLVTPAPVLNGTSSPVFTTPSPSATVHPADANSSSLSSSWVVGPVIGSLLGILTVVVVIYFTRRRQKQDAGDMDAAIEMDNKDVEDDNSSRSSTLGKAQLHSEDVQPKELEVFEIYELPAPEPVGSELVTPRPGTCQSEVDWPLPISPLPALFAMTEIRDEKDERSASTKRHATYYNP